MKKYFFSINVYRTQEETNEVQKDASKIGKYKSDNITNTHI